MAYIGNSPGVSSQRIVTTVTATAGQTTFTPSSGYTVGYLDVYLNGIKLINGTDYTASNGSTVVLTDAAALDDVVELMAYIPRGLSDGYTKAEADARYMDINEVIDTAQLRDGAVTAAKIAAGAAVPSQTGQSGKYLTTDGTNASWSAVDLASRVAKTGDTISGELTFTKDSGNHITFRNADQSKFYGRVMVSDNSDAYGSGERLFFGDGGNDVVLGTANSSGTPTNSYISLQHGGEVNIGAGGATKHLSIATSGLVTLAGNLNLPTVNAATDVQVNSTLLANSSRIRFPSGTSNPSSPATGDGYLNTSTKELRIYTGTDWGFVVFAAPGTQQNPYASVAAAQSNGQATGLVWFKNSAGDAQQLYYDSADGGWILVASNDARSSTLPAGTSRNNLAYTVNRNGTSGALGTADPNSDYLIGGWIGSFSFSRARGIAFGRGSTNGTYSFTSRGTYVDCQFNTSSLSTIVPRASVSITGNGDVYGTANYWCVDGIRADYNADGSIGANSNQTTIGMVGVNASSGDPTSGCYYGHGTSEGNYEGWYDAGGNAADCQGWTTWVR